MRHFDELCAKLNAKTDRDIAYVSLSRAMARSFAESFRKSIDAPSCYKIFDEDNREQSRKYIDVIPSDKEGNDTTQGPWSDADMQFDQEGFFLFSLYVTLEHAPQAYPKRRFKIPCGLCPIDKYHCNIFIGEREDKAFFKEFSWQNNAQLQVNGPEEHICSILAEYLDATPYGNSSKIKSIGFV